MTSREKLIQILQYKEEGKRDEAIGLMSSLTYEDKKYFREVGKVLLELADL